MNTDKEKKKEFLKFSKGLHSCMKQKILLFHYNVNKLNFFKLYVCFPLIYFLLSSFERKGEIRLKRQNIPP